MVKRLLFVLAILGGLLLSCAPAHAQPKEYQVSAIPQWLDNIYRTGSWSETKGGACASWVNGVKNNYPAYAPLIAIVSTEPNCVVNLNGQAWIDVPYEQRDAPNPAPQQKPRKPASTAATCWPDLTQHAASPAPPAQTPRHLQAPVMAPAWSRQLRWTAVTASSTAKCMRPFTAVGTA